MSKQPDRHLQSDEESQDYFWSESWQQSEGAFQFSGG